MFPDVARRAILLLAVAASWSFFSQTHFFLCARKNGFETPKKEVGVETKGPRPF